MLQWIHRRMSVGARLVLIAALLFIPIAMFAGLFVVSANKSIAFAHRELAGTAFIHAMWPAFDDRGDTNAEAITAARAKYDPMFGTAVGSESFLSEREPSKRRAAGSAFILAVADASNLTLDPDLDSFYVMDAVTARMPALHSAVSDLNEGMTAGAPATEIAIAINNLDVSIAALQRSIDSAMKANSGETREALAPSMLATAKAVATARAAALAGQPINELAFDEAADALWSAASAELDRLLMKRIAMLQNDLTIWLGGGLFVLAVAGVLIFLISGAIAKRIGDLITAMQKLAADDATVEIPCQQDTNETGAIAKALASFKESLKERLRLRAEAAAVQQQTAARLREMEEKHAEATRDLASVIAYTKEGLQKLYEGDLTFRLKEYFPVDFKSIRMDYNQTLDRLESIMRAIVNSAETMGSTAGEIASAAGDLSHRTEQQAAGLEETAAALEQITVTVKQNAGTTARMRTVAADAGADATASSDVLRRTVAAMASIERSSDEISRILSVLDEITFQTNLLALNAGVEAARAGDAGRGFAVVASEVRALAQRSAESAREIKALIAASANDVSAGAKLVAQTAESLDRITQRVAEINSLVTVVASASEEEARGVSEVNTAVNQMDQITQQNAAMVEQSTAASRSLADEAESLSQSVRQFKVTPSTGGQALRLVG